MEPMIITAAVNGSEHGRDATPHIPLTPDEIVESAYEAYRAGAAIAHVHARDADGKPVHDVASYEYVIAELASRCDMLVHVTTEPVAMTSGDGRLMPLNEERLVPITASPELASFASGVFTFGEETPEAPPGETLMMGSMGFLRRVARAMQEYGTKPELSIYHDGMVATCLQLAREGLIDDPLYFQFVLGMPGGSAPSAAELLHLLTLIPSGTPWSVMGTGEAGMTMAMLGMVLGGHVRVGLEDQLYYKDGVLARNEDLVGRIVRMASEFGRPIASPADTRRILGIPARPLVAA